MTQIPGAGSGRPQPAARPFPPGRYPVVVVGSGPGALQVAYALRRLGVEPAVLSRDEEPGGMFRHYPLFQRLISWSKAYPPGGPEGRLYYWHDWNSLIVDDPQERALLPEFMDGSSIFPSREEMARSLVAFAARTRLRVRYGVTWEGTRREAEGFTLLTSDGAYQARVLVFAIGMAQPWKAPIPGIEPVPHYVEAKPLAAYTGKRVLIIGKRNSAFELADALLPVARQLVLLSPRPPLLSLLQRSAAGVRARYAVPYEDHALGGNVFVLDAAIERVERTADGYRVHAQGTTRPGPLVLAGEEAIVATGFATPLGDLRALGVATFAQDRLPGLTPFWESTTVPGIYFAGATSQGAVGLRKHGIPSNSGGIGGFRHNARVLARHLVETHFGQRLSRPTLHPEAVVPYLLSEATRASELWNQRAYLARVVAVDRARGITDEGIQPLAWFVDAPGPDAAAIVLETDATGDHHPAVYVRRGGRVTEHVLPGDPLLTFERPDHHGQLADILRGLLA